MKALILSGGKGSRLRPFTYTNAKQLVPIANKPVLFYAIESLVASGIDDVGIIVGDTADQVMAAVGDGQRFSAKVTYIRQNEPLGIAHAIASARDFLQGERFVVYLGDNLVVGGIAPLVKRFREEQSAARIVLHEVANPQAFGVAELRDGRVVRVVEKPSQPPSNLAVIGIYFFDQRVFDIIAGQRPSRRGELEITDAIQGLIDAGADVHAEVLDSYWIDTGKTEDILEANQKVLDTLVARNQASIDERTRIHEPILLEPDVIVRNSVLRGPLIVGRGTRIDDCYVGPYSAIDHGCVLRGVRIEASIVMESTTLENLHWPIEHSLIGRHVTLRGGRSVGGGYRLRLGDHSEMAMPDA